MPKKAKVTEPNQATAPAPQPVTVTQMPTALCAECGDEMIPALLSGHYIREHPIAVARAQAALR
jgi:hypothetical protein